MSIYNGKKFLSKSIKSVLNQTYTNYEFIIIDDASKDNSLDLMNSYALKDNRIKIIKNKVNIGLTKSLNKGISIAQGEFIVRQDGDDFFLPNHLEKLLFFFNNNPEYAFCGVNGFSIQNKKDLLNFFEFNDIRKNLLFRNCFNHSGIVIRKKIFEKYGKYDETYRYGQDYELWCRLIYKYGLKGANLKDWLIIRNMPIERFLNKNIPKFIIQRVNSIRTKFRYLKYSQYQLKSILSILIRIIEILTLSHLMGKFSKFLS
jgi:glycosyltransferase involved in cell wall biosynthesis